MDERKILLIKQAALTYYYFNNTFQSKEIYIHIGSNIVMTPSTKTDK